MQLQRKQLEMVCSAVNLRLAEYETVPSDLADRTLLAVLKAYDLDDSILGSADPTADGWIFAPTRTLRLIQYGGSGRLAVIGE